MVGHDDCLITGSGPFADDRDRAADQSEEGRCTPVGDDPPAREAR
jgi:hypothetical protein